MPPPPHRVAVLLSEPAIGFDATIPSLVFGAARDTAGNRLYQVRLCSVDPGPVACHGDFAISTGSGTDHLAALDDAQTVIVPGTLRRSVRAEGAADPALRAAFDRIPQDARIMSLCTGAFVLAAWGLLDGRPATTHWESAETFRALYPAVRLDERPLFVDEGDVLTSAGLSAGMDLCLHVVARDAGREVANRVARHCVSPPHRDGNQAQYIELPSPPAGDTGTTATREWASRHLGDQISVDDLAAHACMSLRTFNRRFRAETGTPPGQWLARERVRQCQELLESTDLPVETIADRVGFGTATTLRNRFRDVTGTSPTVWRNRFGAPNPISPMTS